MKKDKKMGIMAKGWTALTTKMKDELMADAVKNETRLSTWRERQVYLVDAAKAMLVHKLGQHLPDDPAESKVKISDRFMVQYYNARFTEGKALSEDMLQRTRDVLREYRENPIGKERETDQGRSLHFDVASGLAEIADLAFVPLWEDDNRAAGEEQKLDNLLGKLLTEIRAVTDDTRDYLDQAGNPLEHMALIFKLFCHVDEYVQKLTHAELDEMTDQEIVCLIRYIQEMMDYLHKMLDRLPEESGMEMRGDGIKMQMMITEFRTSGAETPEIRMNRYLLNAMLNLMDLAFERAELESCLRGLRYNNNRMREEKFNEYFRRRMGSYRKRISETD